MTEKKAKLFVRFSTNPEAARERAQHCDYFCKPALAEDRCGGLRYWRYKEIYLPATRDFPKSPKLVMDRDKGEDYLVLSGDRKGKGRKTTYNHWGLQPTIAANLMEQAMERVGMDRLPSFAFSRRSFRGTLDGIGVLLSLDSVSDCPKGMQGSYLHLEAHGWLKYSLAELRRASVALIGATSAWEPGCDYFELLKKQYPTFPWTWKKSAS